jgi:transposase-like protein
MKTSPQEPAVLAPPTECPFCHSVAITTAAEKVDASSYWRCTACGEMWNLGRLQTSTNRYNQPNRWR